MTTKMKRIEGSLVVEGMIDFTKSRTYNEVIVTPTLAGEWINQNYKNRPLSQRTLEDYARAMKGNEWKINGESLKFDREGHLVDGQHRLYACVEADASFVTDIRTGLDVEAMVTVDTGKRRTVSDVLAIKGERYTLQLAAACVWIHKLDSGMSSVKSKEKLSVIEVEKILEKHPSIRDSVRRMVMTRLFYASESMFAAIHCLTKEKHGHAADSFFDQLYEGVDLSATSPVYILREKLMRNRNAKLKLPLPELAAYIIKGWNNFLTGKSVSVLRMNADEPFPEIL